MKKFAYILSVLLLLCFGCEMRLSHGGGEVRKDAVRVARYDRIETRYLTTGDFAALQQMNIDYPMETRTLIEDILDIGDVSDPNINSKFLGFFQDTTLQTLIMDTELEYADMSDIERGLDEAFGKLKKLIKGFKTPVVYAQVGALNQSIVVGDGAVGISLDKYLGEDYALYKKFFVPAQRAMMTRDYVVPDCLCFYLLSLYPLENHDFRPQRAKDLHVARVMWVVNKVLDKKFFRSKHIDEVDNAMRQNKHITVEQLLKSGLE